MMWRFFSWLASLESPMILAICGLDFIAFRYSPEYVSWHYTLEGDSGLSQQIELTSTTQERLLDVESMKILIYTTV